MKKRGELTTQQIVGLIILIVSFAVILFFIFRLDLGQTTDKEICHNSVILKSNSVVKSGNLDCKTSYVCITNGNDCENFNEDYKKEIDLNSKQNVKEQVSDAISEEISDCWWMFGEGKINFGGVTDIKGYHCAICSIIKFDNSVKEEISDLIFENVLINPDERYAIYMGINPGAGDDEFLEPKIILSSEIGDKSKSKCDVFDLTQA